MIPLGETVRWTSASAFRPWTLVLAIAAIAAVWLLVMLYAGTFLDFGWVLVILGILGIAALIVTFSALFPEAEMAVTDGHIVWCYPMDILGRVSGRSRGSVALDAIDYIELEEGGDTITLHGDNASDRVEDIAGGQLEELARVIDRPARIWRVCRSPGAMGARRWSSYVGAIGAGASAFCLFMALTLFLDGGEQSGNFGMLTRFAGTLMLAFAISWFAMSASRLLPHLLAGRRLTGDERRDFVGWMTDLRWQGAKPDGSDDARLPRSRLEGWAMRVAYGEIPDIGEREPETLIPGAFPPASAGADTT
jgi:hypothetical protein